MKNNDSSQVLKASIVYILVSLVNKGIGFFTVPLYTRILTTEQMGVSTTWVSWLTILMPITSLSLVSGSMYIAMNKFGNQRESYQSSALALSTLTSVVCLVVFLIFNGPLTELFTLPKNLMTFMFIYLILSPALDMWMLKLRYEYSMKSMAIITLLSNLTSSAFAVTLVWVLKDTNYDLGAVRIFATYSVLGIFALYYYFRVFLTGRVFYNRVFWKFGIKISVPLIIHTLSKNILDVSDRLMISYYSGKSAVGIYGTVYSVSALSLVVWNSINSAFVPYLYEKLDEHSVKGNLAIRKITNSMIIMYAIVCIGLTAIAPEIVTVLAPKEYYEAVYIIPPIAAGIFLTCIYNVFANVILFHNKSVGIMFATLVASATSIGLNTLFIPIYGYIAASYTTLIAYIILAILQGVMMIRIHGYGLYNMKNIFRLSILVVLTCVSFTFVYKNTMIRYLIVLLLFLSLIVFRKYFFKVLRELKSINDKK